MGCGLSSGGGKRSLDYLFGSGEAPKAATSKPTANNAPVTAVRDVPSVSTEKPASQLVEARQTPAIPVGVNRPLNNYNRADGQKPGNFITISEAELL
ncbi:protein SPIRAL1-like 1 isoform X2 [Silene latifolia]|uniref:protein SPIRAL1-like 1 isoform X2 n=1 Tax=Silene latifolia TaxID=37657 RepID=UPI003D7728D4